MNPTTYPIQEVVGKSESRSVFPQGDLGGRVAGRYVHFSDVGSAHAAGYRSESYAPWITLQGQIAEAVKAHDLPLGKL